MLGKVTKHTVEKLPLNAMLWDTALVGLVFAANSSRRFIWSGTASAESNDFCPLADTVALGQLTALAGKLDGFLVL